MLICADEFLFFNPAVLPALLPTLANGAAFVMTSSVSPDGDSPITQLLDVKYKDGTNVVKKLNYIKSCRECERRGTPETCTHIARMSPPFYLLKLMEAGRPEHFQTWSGQEKLERLMSQNPDSFDREMLNIGSKPTLEAAFRQEWIDAMVSTKYSDSQRTVNHLFVTIDPSAAKDRNLYVLTSAFFIDGQCVVCWLLG
jgi:hypothetical protein